TALGVFRQTIAFPLYSLGNEMSLACGWLPRTWGKSYSNSGVLVNRWTETPRNIATQGDVLLVCKGSGYGKTVICDVKEAHIARQIMAVKKSDALDMKYVCFFLMANLAQIKSKGQGVIPGIDRKSVLNLEFPFPPLTEQKRIVAKIEELLPYIDRYEQAWSRLEAFNKRFPSDMQKSLLQMAIQGNLVEQRPEEGTAEELYQQIQAEKRRLVKEGKIKKEKPLPEISEDEVPFEIPESWKWVRLSNVVDVRDGTHDTPKYVTDGIPLVTSKNLVEGGINFDTAKLISKEDSQAINIRSRVDDGDILFAMIGTIGNPVLVKKDREFSIKNMALFKQIGNNLLDMDYLLQFLKMAQIDMKKRANASVQSFVSLSVLRNYFFPLPPLVEQKRIVAKLEELLPLCERLK
ncbi:MAG: hypothetical protein HDT18_04625, partial [Oscillibacter sp.]|nr:hypothetical protein [Oscillibacter sp.]